MTPCELHGDPRRGLEVLAEADPREGCRMGDRVFDGFVTQTNVFDRLGGLFFAVYAGATSVVIGGVQTSERSSNPRIWRLHRVHVLSTYRRSEVWNDSFNELDLTPISSN